MNPLDRPVRRPLLAGALAAALLLTACGGDDSSDSSDASDVTVPAVECPPAPSSAPDSTVPDAIPDDYVGSIGPVDLCGNPLPELATDVIADDSAVGMTAPTVVGVDFAGDPVRIDPAQDGATMVVFLAHWCPHCNAEIPVLNELRDAGRLPDDLNIVAVSTAPNANGSNFPPGDWLVDMDWQWPAIADGVDIDEGSFLTAEAYGVSGFPFVVLVDGEGKVAARWSGESTADETIDRIATHLPA